MTNSGAALGVNAGIRGSNDSTDTWSNGKFVYVFNVVRVSACKLLSDIFRWDAKPISSSKACRFGSIQLFMLFRTENGSRVCTRYKTMRTTKINTKIANVKQTHLTKISYIEIESGVIILIKM